MPAELRPQPVEVWPAHEGAVRLFVAMQTQWRMGPGGAVGMDYAALPVVVRLRRLRCGRADFERLQVMEAEALEFFAERRKSSGA